MIRIEFHPEADQELEAAKNWYQSRSDLAGRAFATEITNSLAKIAAAPERWPATGSGERRYLLSRFPFSILYRVRASELFVTAVAHQKRRPGYWRHRK
jgi:toxin ParE1/3/4